MVSFSASQAAPRLMRAKARLYSCRVPTSAATSSVPESAAAGASPAASSASMRLPSAVRPRCRAPCRARPVRARAAACPRCVAHARDPLGGLGRPEAALRRPVRILECPRAHQQRPPPPDRRSGHTRWRRVPARGSAGRCRRRWPVPPPGERALGPPGAPTLLRVGPDEAHLEPDAQLQALWHRRVAEAAHRTPRPAPSARRVPMAAARAAAWPIAARVGASSAWRAPGQRVARVVEVRCDALQPGVDADAAAEVVLIGGIEQRRDGECMRPCSRARSPAASAAPRAHTHAATRAAGSAASLPASPASTATSERSTSASRRRAAPGIEGVRGRPAAADESRAQRCRRSHQGGGTPLLARRQQGMAPSRARRPASAGARGSRFRPAVSSRGDRAAPRAAARRRAAARARRPARSPAAGRRARGRSSMIAARVARRQHEGRVERWARSTNRATAPYCVACAAGNASSRARQRTDAENAFGGERAAPGW